MITVGYQGIGKSTLAYNHLGIDCIDLESSNFWVDGKRADDWYKPYCQISVHLSKQGYVVFTSSHEVVRNYLKEISDEVVVVIYPAIELKDAWIKKLEDRYNLTTLEKDYKSLMNAKDRYVENISELMNSGLYTKPIDDIDYSLKDIIESLLEKYSSAIMKYNFDISDAVELEDFIPRLDLWEEKRKEYE